MSFLRAIRLNDSCPRHSDEISDRFPRHFLSFSALAQPVYAASRTPTSSCICCYFLYLSVCLHQGAEAQNDAATQRAQVPDTRLHRVSEAEVCLLWPQVTTEREGGVGRGKHILSDKDTDAHPEKWTSPPLLSFHLSLGQPPPLNLNCEILTFFCVTCWTVCGFFFCESCIKRRGGNYALKYSVQCWSGLMRDYCRKTVALFTSVSPKQPSEAWKAHLVAC